MKFDVAKSLAEALTFQARDIGLVGPDGKPVQYKVTEVATGKRGPKQYTVKMIKMVEKINLMSGKKFWIEDDAPVYMDPSCESYWSM